MAKTNTKAKIKSTPKRKRVQPAYFEEEGSAEKEATMKSRKIRFSEEDQNAIQTLADIYAGGNFSAWVRHAALNCERKFLVPNENK